VAIDAEQQVRPSFLDRSEASSRARSWARRRERPGEQEYAGPGGGGSGATAGRTELAAG
jgi:hypothetical protein